MAIVKKNIVSIIFGVVALIAMIAAFYPMGGKFSDLQTEVKARFAKLQEAQSVIAKPRYLPDVDLAGSSTQTPLGVFPMPKITTMVKKYMDQLISQSLGVLQTAVDINQAECTVGPKNDLLLIPNSLPEPAANSENLFKEALQPEYDRIVTKVLLSGLPPTVDDIKKADDALLAFNQSKGIPGPDGKFINDADLQAAYEKDSKVLPTKLRAEAAAKYRMYLDPAMLAAPKEIVTSPNTPDAPTIWFAQVTLWVQEDVCRALAEVNSSARNVQDAPVKRLMGFTVPPRQTMYVADPAAASSPGVSSSPQGGADIFPFPLTGDPKRVFTVSPSGRFSNMMYDVISFKLVLHVDQSRIPEILKALSHNRFISVVGMNLQRIDTQPLKDDGYFYGDHPIAEISLDCEMIQLREWTVPWMPAKVKSSLLGATDYVFQLKKPTDK